MRSTPNAQAATIGSLARAFEPVKGMRAQGLEWGDGDRALGREAIGAILRQQMDQTIDEPLDRRPRSTWPTAATAPFASSADRARRYRRAVPRTRRFVRGCVAASLCTSPRCGRSHGSRAASPGAFAGRWRQDYPKAVVCLCDDLDDLLACWHYKPVTNAIAPEPPTPANGALAKSDGEPGPCASFPTAPQWIASCSPSSITKTKTRASAPLSCRHKPFDVARPCKAGPGPMNTALTVFMGRFHRSGLADYARAPE